MVKLKQLFSQRDARWKNILLGFNTSTYTIGGYGCLLCCLSSIEGSTPDVMNDRLKSINGFANGGYYVWGKFTELFGIKEKLTVTPVRLTDTQVKEIQTAIDNGYPVMCGIDSNPKTAAYDQHFVVLTDYGGEDFICFDPWDGTIKPLANYLGGVKKTFRDTVEQYVVYEVKNSTGGNLDAEEALLKELSEMRASRDKWKSKYEELDKETTADIQAKVKHIEELQKTIAEQNSQLTLASGSQESNVKEIEKLREELTFSKGEQEVLRAVIEGANKENERLTEKLKSYQTADKGFFGRLIDFLRRWKV